MMESPESPARRQGLGYELRPVVAAQHLQPRIPMFTLMHSDVIRIQLCVPQDQALGLGAGVGALVRVPE
jgi:hypothetical protein